MIHVLRWRKAWSYALLALLLLPRVPSLVQPAGPDQALYAYAGSRILAGGLPYRDAWDQKPPGVHFAYAGLHALWPHESMVPAADLLVSAAVALLLLPLGRRLFGSSAAGLTAAALFLLLGDPTFNRLAGVRIRAQCETFIALAVTAAMLLAAGAWRRDEVGASGSNGIATRLERLAPLLVGALIGLAFTFKYNAIVYAAPIALSAMMPVGTLRATLRRLTLVGLGALVPVLAVVAIFAAGGTLTDLYYATILYNLEYSGETYAGPLSFVTYLLSFPVQHARVDALWATGGLGCIVLLGAWLRRPERRDLLLPVVWVAAACLSIAINGSRGLPQYFVQAAPALALSAGAAAAILWPAGSVGVRLRPLARAAGILLVAYGAWRVADFDKIPRNLSHDLAFLAGRITRDAHLERYGGEPGAKYAALSVRRLGAYLKARTGPSDAVYVFGFSPGAYLAAGRVSSSRFFWSRPVLVGFNETVPGYGADGVLQDLENRPPKYVVLQIHDWAAPPADSATFFASHPRLGPWLRARYQRVEPLEDYEIWVRRPGDAQAGALE